MFVAFSLLALLPPEAAGSDVRPGPRFLEKRNDTRTQRDHQPSIRVDVNLVLVPVTVTDPLGRIVTGLEQSDFQVFEDKVPQRIHAS